MMETIRSRNGHAQPNFGYGSSAYDGIQFSDPWARTSAPLSNHIAASTMGPDSGLIPSMSRSLRTSMSSPFNLAPPPRAPVYGTDMYQQNNDIMNKYNAVATYAEPTSAPLVTAGTAAYGGLSGGYSSSSYEPMVNRNSLQNSLIDYPRSQPPSGSYSDARDNGLNDALDSARGMMALSQTDTRSMGASHRNSSTASSSSYYPGSTTSSISSASSYPYFGSMDSAADMSTTDGMYDPSRPSLPRPAGMITGHGLPHQAGAQSMMSTFNSRVSSSTQKKHKCKICDKRFTRPSSLQTHMYSHTGEKPFACDVEGCGRQFSVVSNLRRHRKVHKGLPDMDAMSNNSG